MEQTNRVTAPLRHSSATTLKLLLDVAAGVGVTNPTRLMDIRHDTFTQVTEFDRSVLRRLADDGNEEAADRLAELAAERGDLEELRRLVDDGTRTPRIGWPSWPQSAAP